LKTASITTLASLVALSLLVACDHESDPVAARLMPDLTAADNTSANAGDWGEFEVGSVVWHIELSGAEGERRPMDVLLLYPADKQANGSAPRTVYASRLNGVPIIDPNNADRWVPMSFVVAAERAREGVPVDQGGPSFPLIIFSHPAASDPQNVAPTLERLASHGFIVAAPWHNGDTQEEQRIDIINQQAGAKILPCFDAGPSPCLDGLQKTVQNRARDISAVLDNITSYFGHRVDTERVGLLGQSRGSLTALVAGGGSTAWNIDPEPRIDAVMMIAMANRSATFAQNLSNITIPSLFVAGKADRNTPMSISVDAFHVIPSEQKGLVVLDRAEHGVYSINRCAQMQAAGAIYQAEPRAIGEQLTMENIMLSANSGTPLDYCSYDSFVDPVDITPLVKAMTGYEVTPANVPRQLDSRTAMRVTLELAVTFFDAALNKDGGDDESASAGVHFKQYLSPQFLLTKEGAAVNYAESVSFKGRAVACDDPDLAFLDVACTQ
jgi:predicted dienelactone hydrolase